LDAHHQPVLLREALVLLAPERGGTFVDGTVGLGGHARALLDASLDLRLVGIDRDPQALAVARQRLVAYGERVQLVQGNFQRLAELPEVLAAAPLAGVLVDLGVSSLQLERAERGFSLRREGPLDMRMGGGELTAADVVNRNTEAELERIFRHYGEEIQARRIARAVVAARAAGPIGTTTELAALVAQVKGGARRGRSGRIHPATQVFQALRIEVNDELTGLAAFIDQAVRLLGPEGRLVILSYHSLEDRIVKDRFRELSRGHVDPVTGRPLAETRLIEVLTKKPIQPAAAEVEANPRSRSARLRAARRLGGP
jgi:16S rRNA (cytosine1402-N4)-methyltransferase